MLDLLVVGERIAVERKALGLTQTQLAQRSRTSRATITALETGAQRELGFNKIMAILTVLGLDLRLTAANAGRPTLEDLQRERDR
ncbi:transcriptional regulator with XRE-family HTH domain [Skermanella aerolata]|uniref:helix-turn-helix domain-containing protein n=1 Tax=Skermanella aerolata TaxID=393310 RepID=UPI003D2592E8